MTKIKQGDLVQSIIDAQIVSISDGRTVRFMPNVLYIADETIVKIQEQRPIFEVKMTRKQRMGTKKVQAALDNVKKLEQMAKELDVPFFVDKERVRYYKNVYSEYLSLEHKAVRPSYKESFIKADRKFDEYKEFEELMRKYYESQECL